MSERAEEKQEPLEIKDEGQTPGWWILIFAVIFPFFAIGFELYTQMCAESFFDPMPTLYHKLLVLIVPSSNLFVWWKLRYGSRLNVGVLLFLSAISIGIAGYYTIIFLPIIPVSLIAIIFFGIGLLPFGPVVSLIGAVKLYNRLKAAYQKDVGERTYMLKGILSALLILMLLDMPSAVTYFGVDWASSDQSDTREKGIKLLRHFGDRDLLLRLSYDGSRSATGLLSFAALTMSNNDFISSAKAREIFYRVTGEPFNLHPVPYTGNSWGRFDDFRFDIDQGGAEVGGRIKGLDLISSRIDGSVNGDSGVAYLEWTLEFKNTSFRPREARVQLALPPEAVVSRVTLWVNGEEREAAFAGRSKVRQAYESVVRTRQDPLLVTTSGNDRILAQAFPVGSEGGTIKFKIGITAPLTLKNSQNASFVLPIIVDRNFNIGENIEHSIWFESKRPIYLSDAKFKNEMVKPDLHRLAASLNDKGLSALRKELTTKRDPNVIQLISGLKKDEWVLQSVVDTKPDIKDALIIVVDGSVKVASHIEAIVASLASIPAGKKIGLMVASGDNVSIDIARWSDSHRKRIETALREHDFDGGQDNAPALMNAIRQLEQFETAELLWIHAPQPILFEGTAAMLGQATSRLSRLPKVSLYSVSPGPNKLLDKLEWPLTSRTIPRINLLQTDLEHYFKSLFSNVAQPLFERRLIDPDIGIERGSEHIARLWARDQVDSLLAKGAKQDATSLAANYQLVTAVSGAVVLENQQQYKDSDLTPVGENTVPTIPEPHQWVLAFIMVAFILWFLKQNKFALIRKI